MQVLNEGPIPGNFADSFNTGLQKLVQMKLAKLQQRQQLGELGKAFESLGLPAQNAQAFARLPKEMQSEFVKQGMLSSLQEPLQETPAQLPIPQQVSQDPVQDSLFQPSAPGKLNLQEVMSRALAGGMSQQQQQEILGPQQPQEITQSIEQITPAPVAKQKPKLLTATQRAADARERAEIRRQKAQQDKEARIHQHNIDKRVKPYVELLDKKGGAAARESELVLERMEKLIDTGKLTSATMYNIRKKMEHSGKVVGGGIGTALGALAGSTIAPAAGTFAGATIGGGIGTAAGELLMPKFVGSKEDQEFTKLSLSFMNRLKDIFGGRIAVQEMQLYMDSIPTLSMTDEGKRQVIKDMQLLARGWKHKKQIKDRIVKNNNGHYPVDLEQRVDEASKPFMEKIKRDFLA